MQTLAIDGRAGASGDMLLGVLLDLGADRDALAPIESALGVSYVVDRVERCGIEATGVTVVIDDQEASGADSSGDTPADDHEKGDTQDGGHEHEPADDHDHDHGHGHTHEDSHHHEQPTTAEGHGPHRTYTEVLDIVDEIELPKRVLADAKAIFERLGRAEAAVHGTDLDGTTFHEVGADDAIADVTGVTALLADLDVDRVVTTPLATGSGTVDMSHGTYPIPGPAVVEIAAAADWSMRGGPVEAELLTPTGGAILAELATGVDALPTLSVDETGYGAGDYDLDPHPNVVRGIVGTAEGPLAREPIVVLETTLDDATPETLGSLQETLADVGARDVTVVPTTMKKARPGHLVKVIVAPADEQRVARKLAAETGTLGVRAASAGHRWTAHRRIETTTLDVEGTGYEVDVKVASDEDGVVYDVSAEHDDVLAVATATGRPLREIRRHAEQQFRETDAGTAVDEDSG